MLLKPFVKHLKEQHYFTKEVDPTGSNFTKWLYKESLEKVLETVPEQNENDFFGDIIGIVKWLSE